MRLSEAIKKSRRQRSVGWLISLTALLLLIMSLVLYIYRITENDQSLFRGISQILNNIATLVYQNTFFLMPLWEYAPELYYPNILVEGNLKFLAVVGVFVLGIIMRDSGIYLSRRINKVRQKAEEKVWERSLTGEVSSNDVLAIEIPMESKDSWYTRPEGIVTLAVIGGYIVNVISKLSGL